MFFPVSEWFPAFVLTLAVEIPIVLVVLRRVVREPFRLIALVVFANLATHPAVWFVFTQLFLVGSAAYIVAAESWAIGVEALFYAVVIPGLSPGRAVAVAVVANVASAVIGRIVEPWWREVVR